MTDTIFTYDDAVPASSSLPEDLVTTSGLDVNGKVVLDSTSSKIKISDDGVVTSTTNQIVFNSIRDTSLFETSQVVNTTSATTAINLDIASTIILNHNLDTTITFTPAITGARFFLMLRKKDSAADMRSLKFGGGIAWLGEQTQYPVWTQTPLAEDIIWGFVDTDGSPVTRLPIANYTTRNTKSGGVYWRGGAARYLKQPRDVPGTNVTGVESGQIITGMADKTLNAASIKVSAAEFPSEVQIIRCLLNIKDIPITFTPPGATEVTLDARANNLWRIDGQSNDITNVFLTLHTEGNGVDEPIVTIIYRSQDGTENPYTIFFDPATFKYEGDPVITNTPYANDFYVIYSVNGENYLSWYNNFGILV